MMSTEIETRVRTVSLSITNTTIKTFWINNLSTCGQLLLMNVFKVPGVTRHLLE